MKLKSSHKIVNDDGDIIMGKGRMEILESIAQTGSINKTSKELKMSYKSVWSKLKSTQENFKKAVVLADKKKGTRLTKEGKILLEKYKQLTQDCIKADDNIFNDIFSV